MREDKAITKVVEMAEGSMEIMHFLSGLCCYSGEMVLDLIEEAAQKHGVSANKVVSYVIMRWPAPNYEEATELIRDLTHHKGYIPAVRWEDLTDELLKEVFETYDRIVGVLSPYDKPPTAQEVRELRERGGLLEFPYGSKQLSWIHAKLAIDEVRPNVRPRPKEPALHFRFHPNYWGKHISLMEAERLRRAFEDKVEALLREKGILVEVPHRIFAG